MIHFKCSKCSSRIRVADEFAGKKGKCPSCKEVLVVPRPVPQPVDDGDMGLVPMEDEIPKRPASPKSSTSPQKAPVPMPQKATSTPARKPAAVKTKSAPPEDDDVEVAEVVDEGDDDTVEEVDEVLEVIAVTPSRKNGKGKSARKENVTVVEEEEEEERPKKRSKKNRRPKGEYADCPECGASGSATRVGYTLWGGFLGPWILNHVRCSECSTAYNGRSGKLNTTGIIVFVSVSLAISLVLIGISIALGLLEKL